MKRSSASRRILGRMLSLARRRQDAWRRIDDVIDYFGGRPVRVPVTVRVPTRRLAPAGA